MRGLRASLVALAVFATAAHADGYVGPIPLAEAEEVLRICLRQVASGAAAACLGVSGRDCRAVS